MQPLSVLSDLSRRAQTPASVTCDQQWISRHLRLAEHDYILREISIRCFQPMAVGVVLVLINVMFGLL